MSLSTQSVISDGTLSVLDVSIEFFNRDEIHVFFDDVEDAREWAWVGTSDPRILFSPPVDNGVVVVLQRRTNVDELRHVFSRGAAFTAQTLDEDLKQVLRIAQEASENIWDGKFRLDLDMNGHRVTRIGNAVASTDAVPLGQMTSAIAAGDAAALATAKAYTDSIALEGSNHAVRAPELIAPMPAAAQRANKLLAFDSFGNPIATVPSSDSAQQLRLDLQTAAQVPQYGFSGAEMQSVMDNSLPLQDYAAIRAYTGRALSVRVVGVVGLSAPDPTSGVFRRSSDNSTVDNGGTVIVDAAGRRWKRVFDGPLYVGWFGARGALGYDDADVIQKTIDTGGNHSTIVFNRTAANVYYLSHALKFYPGQKWQGTGGIDVSGLGTKLRLTAPSTSVAEPMFPNAVTYGFNPEAIYFDAQAFAPVALSLYNTSYAKIDICSANCATTGGAAFLLDSDTIKQCYFNTFYQPRGFATGVGGVCMRFIRGANANQVKGGKMGSSTRGMEFLSLSSGNVVDGTDFEDNTDRHIYIDSPNNVFLGGHMESAPVGFHLTANATNTQRAFTTFATTCVVNVQDDGSKVGTVLDTRSETSGIRGDLRFGGARWLSTYLTTGTTLDYNPDLVTNTGTSIIRLFLNSSTSGQRALNLYNGPTLTVGLDAGTGAITHADVLQEAGAGSGVYRRSLRRAAPPGTAASVGDKIIRTNPSVSSPVTEWTCITAGTPGVYVATAWIVGRGATGSRPTLDSNSTGVQYMDNTLAAAGKPIWWNGAAWVDALGAIV